MIATVIVHFMDVAPCVQLCRQLLAADLADHRILVVDNGSTPEVYDTLSDQLTGQAVTLLRSDTNLGLGGGVNFAIGMLDANEFDWLHIINPDVDLIDHSYLDKAVALMQADATLAAIGPGVVQPSGDPQETVMTFPGLRSSILSGGRLPDFDYSPGQGTEIVNVLNGVCLVVRRAAFEQVNGFDEDFFMYVEENDLCKRFRDAGYKVAYLRGNYLLHHGASRVMTRPRMNFRDVLCRVNQVMFCQKHAGFFVSSTLAGYFFLGFAVRFLTGWQLEGLSRRQVLAACFKPSAVNAWFRQPVK